MTYDTFKRYRDLRKMTDYSLQKDFGISQVTLSQWGHNKTTPSMKTQMKLKDVLKISDKEFCKQ